MRGSGNVPLARTSSPRRPGSLARLRCSPAFGRGPAHPPEAGGCRRLPTALGSSGRGAALRFAGRYGSSDALRGTSPSPLFVSPLAGPPW